jgi:hypothetical protein
MRTSKPPATGAQGLEAQEAPTPMDALEEVEEEGINWSLRNEDGSFNLGMLVFMALTAACAGVWAAGVASWLSCSRWG